VGFISPLITLSRSDVAKLTSTVDALAASYSGGRNAAGDKAAVAAFQAGLDVFALGVWGEAHVTTSTASAQFQTALTAFTKSFTGGANPTQDNAAWQTLLTALNGLAAPGTAQIPASTPATQIITALEPGLASFISPILTGAAMTSSEVAQLKSLVDTFSTSDTFGANASQDQAALITVEAGLNNLLTTHLA
jgi:hypothetical protein